MRQCLVEPLELRRHSIGQREKLKLSEFDICDLFITPALKASKWDPLTQIRREVTLTPGPVIVRGNLSSRNKKKKKFADYVLSWKPSLPIAVVEAKDNNFSISQGFCLFDTAAIDPFRKSANERRITAKAGDKVPFRASRSSN